MKNTRREKGRGCSEVRTHVLSCKDTYPSLNNTHVSNGSCFQSTGFRVSGVGFQVSGFGLRILGFGFWDFRGSERTGLAKVVLLELCERTPAHLV